MNLLRVIFLLGLVYFVFVLETKGQDLKLIDVIEKPNCEYLLALLDGFSQTISSDPKDTVGHLVFFPGSSPIQNANYERYMRFYIVRQELTKKLFLYTAKPKSNPTVEFWAGPLGLRPLEESQPLSTKLSIQAVPILFDSELFEVFIEKGKKTFVGLSCNACCFSSLDWDLLSQFLEDNSDLTAYVVIRGKQSRHTPLRKYLRNDMKDADIDTKRVKFLFSKRNLVNTSHFSEVSVFLSGKEIRSAASLR